MMPEVSARTDLSAYSDLSACCSISLRFEGEGLGKVRSNWINCYHGQVLANTRPISKVSCHRALVWLLIKVSTIQSIVKVNEIDREGLLNHERAFDSSTCHCHTPSMCLYEACLQTAEEDLDSHFTDHEATCRYYD